MKNLALICLLLLNYNSFSLSQKILSQFDDKLIHFGFALSINNSGFDLERNFPGK